MSPTVALILALLATHMGQKLELQIDEHQLKQLREREEHLHQEMTRLLQEIGASSGKLEKELSALQQQWPFWFTAAAMVPVLLAVRCCFLRRRKHCSASCRKARASSKKQDLPSVKALKELLDELLSACRVLSRRNFMPELHPATGMDSASETWSIEKSGTTYRLLVILRPPPGHSFSPDTTEGSPARCIRVALECLCPGEQLLGQMCFLHPSGGQLPTEQDWYLLDTLCTGSQLDTDKVAHWVRALVPSAWLLLPQSLHCRLTALPCSECCRFQLSGPSGMQSSIEMVLAVQRGSEYLSLE